MARRGRSRRPPGAGRPRARSSFGRSRRARRAPRPAARWPRRSRRPASSRPSCCSAKVAPSTNADARSTRPASRSTGSASSSLPWLTKSSPMLAPAYRSLHGVADPQESRAGPLVQLCGLVPATLEVALHAQVRGAARRPSCPLSPRRAPRPSRRSSAGGARPMPVGPSRAPCTRGRAPAGRRPRGPSPRRGRRGRVLPAASPGRTTLNTTSWKRAAWRLLRRPPDRCRRREQTGRQSSPEGQRRSYPCVRGPCPPEREVALDPADHAGAGWSPDGRPRGRRRTRRPVPRTSPR